MYGNQSSFGGANRGPASERKRSSTSNRFVDVGFFFLLVACLGIVAVQYSPLLTTTGYNVASGSLEQVEDVTPFGNDIRYDYGRYRRRNYVISLNSRYSYMADGKQYTAQLRSVPLINLLNFDSLTMRGDIAKSGLAVRYNPGNPSQSVPVEIVDRYTKSALVSYIAIFFVGLIFLTFAGMSNLSGEKWRPGQRTAAY